MRYFAPLNQLDDISGGTLLAGRVPLARVSKYSRVTTLGGDYTLTTSLEDVLVPSSLMTLAVGDIVIAVCYSEVHRASGVETPTLTWTMTAMTGTTAVVPGLYTFSGSLNTESFAYFSEPTTNVYGSIGLCTTAGNFGFRLRMQKTATTAAFTVLASTAYLRELVLG